MYNSLYVVQTAYFLIMEIIMKKLIAAAVATSVSAIAVADVSITGNAKYEYFNSKTGTAASTNKANTEVNLSIKGQKGDTGVVMNLEFNTHGDVSNGTITATTETGSETASAVQSYVSTTSVSQRAAGTLDVEDLYLTTKVGDISVKAGNFASGTSALLGEIDNGGRATNKVDLSTTIGGMKVYAGNTGRGDTGESAIDQTALDNNMYAGVSLDVAGNTVQFKKNSPTVDSYGIAGSMNGISYRYEHKDNDAATSDVNFGEIKGEISGVTLGYAWIDADAVDLVTEDDSSIFAVEMASSGTGDGKSTGNKQIMAATTVDGNKVTFKSGSLENGISSGVDKDYQQISVTRALASGANAVVTYTTKDYNATTDTDTLEVELNVSF